MKILALVPARGGSKRLPGKNIRLLGQKPLITWSIDVVKGIPEISHILVSTDSVEIAQVAQDAGALVPWLRPSELATDSSKSVEVVIHALDWYEPKYGSIDGVLLLQPTSPFRSRKTVIRGIELFQNNAFKSVLGVSPSHSHPLWTFTLQGGKLYPYIAKSHSFNTRSQDLPSAYVINGAFYLATPQQIRETRSFVDSINTPLIINAQWEYLDIDTEWDWQIAEHLVLPIL